MKKMLKKGKLPLVRTQEIDDKIDLQYEVPEEVRDEDCTRWILENMEEIAGKWENIL